MSNRSDKSTQERIQDTIFEMNKFVVDKNPMVGLAWRNISDAVQAKFKDVPEPGRTKQVEDLTRQTYYVYIFLSLYARMDDLRSRGILSPNDEMILGWKRSWLPKPDDLGARALDAREQFNGVLLRADDQGPAGSRRCNREFANATKHSLTLESSYDQQ